MKSGLVWVLVLANALFAESAQIKKSFETGEFSGWNNQGEGWSIYGKAASDGEKSAMCTVEKKENPGLKACAMLIEKAGPGWVIKARLDVAGKAKHGSSKASFSLMCIDAAGNTIRESKKQVTFPTTDFQNVALNEIIVPSGTKEVYFMIVVEVVQQAKSKEWWRFDNVVIEVN